MLKDTTELSAYIDSYWDNLRIVDTRETKTSLGLPNPYYVPSTEVVDGFSFPHMFYWDSYFIVQGLFDTQREPDIQGIAENMFDLIRRFGFVPNSNSFSHLSRSQPPLLSTLVDQLFFTSDSNLGDDWLLLAYARLEEEYKTVWLGDQQPHNRFVHKGLSRFYDTNVLHTLAEAESGWDYTTRFEDHALHFLPVDLNALLYKYEVDLSKFAKHLGRTKDSNIWFRLSEQRKNTMNDLMWNDQDGLFYDYDYQKQEAGRVVSLASYVPLFAGMCSDQQAQKLVENLALFETEHGLTTTEKDSAASAGKQWAAPNGWAPLHDFVVDGLLKYGFEEEARRIATKWVNMAVDSLAQHGTLHEKYNVVDPQQAAGGSVYPDQHGFGWTNGVTAKFIRMLG